MSSEMMSMRGLAGMARDTFATFTPEQILDMAAGYDWRSPEARRTRWEMWRRLLGERTRKDAPDRWVAECPADVPSAHPDTQLGQAIARVSHRWDALAA